MPRGGKREGAGRKGTKKADPLAVLSARKRMYVEGLAAGKSKLRAALDAGYAESVARTAKQHIETDDVKAAFRELIQSVIPAEKIAARIAEGMDAVETKLYSFQGMIFDERDVIAWTERREYTKLAAEYGGYFESKQEHHHDHEGKVELVIDL